MAMIQPSFICSKWNMGVKYDFWLKIDGKKWSRKSLKSYMQKTFFLIPELKFSKQIRS